MRLLFLKWEHEFYIKLLSAIVMSVMLWDGIHCSLYLFELFILRKIYYLIVWLEYSGALGKSVGLKKYFGMFTPAAIITKLYTRKWRKSLQKPTWLLFHFTTIHVTYKTKTRLRPRRAITALSPRVWALAWWPREINFQWNVYYIIATLCGGTRKMGYVYAR